MGHENAEGIAHVVARFTDGMDSPVCLREISALVFIGVGIRSSSKRKESDMHATTVAVDLAKSVFQLAVASKRGDRYLRMLLTHGARSVLRAAKVAETAQREVCGVRRWALDVQRRSNHNKAACALANKLARICYATLRDKTPFGETERLNKKITRESFVIPT